MDETFASKATHASSQSQPSKNAMMHSTRKGDADFQEVYHRINTLQQQLHHAVISIQNIFTSANYTCEESVEQYKAMQHSLDTLRKQLEQSNMLHLPLQLSNRQQSIIDVINTLKSVVSDQTDYLNRVTNINARQVHAALKTS